MTLATPSAAKMASATPQMTISTHINRAAFTSFLP